MHLIAKQLDNQWYRYSVVIDGIRYTTKIFMPTSEGTPCDNDGTPEHDEIMKEWITRTWNKQE